ncbi:MAG: hypothetical protein OEY85_08700 [Rhodospirillales bacterium]|nr:hypothetical protein [Rhodospirillales bacterium]
MEIGSNGANPFAGFSGVTRGQDAAAPVAPVPEKKHQPKPEERAEEKKPSLVDQIREIGFSAYAEKIKIENLKELREKILSSMGLSEEDLTEMTSEQRQAIEDIIAREMRQRMAAQSEINGETGTAHTGVPPSLVTDATNLGDGMGVLIALQARDFREDPAAEDKTTKQE